MATTTTRNLLKTARTACPVSDAGWLAAAATKLEDADTVLTERRKDLRDAQRPHWHEANRATRIKAASDRLAAAERRYADATSGIMEQIAAWERGATIYGAADHCPGFSGPA